MVPKFVCRIFVLSAPGVSDGSSFWKTWWNVADYARTKRDRIQPKLHCSIHSTTIGTVELFKTINRTEGGKTKTFKGKYVRRRLTKIIE
jgi:hypothetical protein